VGWSSIYKKQRNFSNMKGIIHLEKIQSAWFFSSMHLFRCYYSTSQAWVEGKFDNGAQKECCLSSGYIVTSLHVSMSQKWFKWEEARNILWVVFFVTCTLCVKARKNKKYITPNSVPVGLKRKHLRVSCPQGRILVFFFVL
jgi:hypothetical protein